MQNTSKVIRGVAENNIIAFWKSNRTLHKRNDIFKDTAEHYIFEDIKSTLLKLGLKFDSFFNESINSYAIH